MIPVENNIIGIHIHSLVRLWGTSDVALDFHRKMLKGIIKKFKIGMFAVYFIFLMLVPSTKVNCQ